MYPYIDIGSLRIGTYGLCAVIAFFISWAIFKKDLVRRRLPAQLAGEFAVIVTLSGVLGAKLYFLLETGVALAEFIHALAQSSGLSWLGGLLAGVGALCVLAAVHRIPLLTLLDMAAPIGAVAYGIGRIGCFMAGDGDYGRPTSLPWGISFPHGTVPVFERVQPTPIYEALFCALLFWLLWRLGRDPRPRGFLAALYLILSGAARFLVEFIKLNPRVYFGLTNEQVLSIVCVIGGTALLLWIRRKRSALRVGDSAAA